ncbi:hypothetical protein [Halomonas ventosae]|nr:hypothetical protein [Halomonas ventosae]
MAYCLLGLGLAVWLALEWLTPAAVTGRLVEYHNEAPVAGAMI